MKHFLVKIAAFFGLLLIVNTVLFVLVDDLFYSIKEKSLAPLQYENSCVYLFADSHGNPLKQNLVDKKVVNLSAASDNYVDMYYKLVYLIADGRKIDAITLEADDHTLSPFRQQFNNRTFTAKVGLKRPIPFIKTLERSTVSAWIMDSFQHYFVLLSPEASEIIKRALKSGKKRKKAPSADEDQEGDLPKATEKKDFATTAKARVASLYTGKGRSEEMVYYLDAIVRVCAKNGIKIVGLKYPLTKEYLDVKAGRDFGAQERMLKNGLPVLDFSTIYENNPEYFSDDHHISGEAGTLFANVILDSLRSKVDCLGDTGLENQVKK